MRLIELYITAFGGLRDRRLAFGPGLTLLYGQNEQGKSTVMACLRSMLYGLSGRSRDIRDNDRRRYAPWDGGRMGAALVFEHRGIRYRLERTFAERKAGDTALLMEDATGRTVPLPTGAEPGDFLLGVSEAEFLQTVFVGQLVAPVHDPDGAVLAKLSNLASTGEENVSFQEVDDRLRRAQVRLRAERGGGGLLNAWQAERSALEERRSRAMAQELEQAERLRCLEGEEAAARDAETQGSALRNRLDRLEILEATAKTVQDHCIDVERQEQSLLGEMGLWEKTWEQETRLMEEAGREDSARIERLAAESVRCHTAGIQAQEEAAAADPAEWGSPWLGRGAVAGYAGIVLFLVAGGLSGLYIQANLFWIAAGALLPATVLATRFVLLSRTAAIQAARRDAALLCADEAARQAELLAAAVTDAETAAAEDRRQRQERITALDSARDILEKSIAAQAHLAQSAREARDAAAAELTRAAAGERLPDIRLREREAYGRAAALRADCARLEAAIRHTPRDPDGIDGISASLAAMELKIREGEAAYDSLSIAREAYREAFDALQADFGPRLNARAASLLSALTGGRYGGLKIAPRFDVRVADASEASYRSWEYLSGGTVDQVYLALRIAVAETIAPPGGLPLLLDDVFIQFDDARTLAGLRVLMERTGQTLLFSCHRRVLDFAAGLDPDGGFDILEL
ncbi:MAG TPA: AAA family ATPase [Clostridia bacterium]